MAARVPAHDGAARPRAPPPAVVDAVVPVLHAVVPVPDMAARVPALDGAARPRAPPPAVVGRVLPPAVAVRGLALVIAARVRVPPLTVITVDNGVVRSPAVHDHRAVVLPRSPHNQTAGRGPAAPTPTAPAAMRKRTLEKGRGEEHPAKKRALLRRLSAPPLSLSQRLGPAAAGGSPGSNKGKGRGNTKGNVNGRGNMGRKAVVSWNMDGRILPNLARPDFRRSIEQCDVFFVQETHLRPDQREMLRALEGFDTFTMYRRMPEGQDTYGGVCAFTRKSLSAQLDGERSSPDIMVLRIGDMHFINAYVAGEHSSASRHFSDWQALHPWDTFSGRKLIELCEENNLRLVNGCTTIPGNHAGFTFFGRKDTELGLGKSTVDYVLLSPAAVGRLSSMDIASPRPDCSDHAATKAVVWVRMEKGSHKQRNGTGTRRKDLSMPREDESDEDLWRLMSQVMEAGELARHAYGALMETAIAARQAYAQVMLGVLGLEYVGGWAPH
ncbi:hypothetical protein R3P38DRAFT_2808226 [Favolaschia claudopus]|uniref:Endonuclease/exonuclease/phosphatase domain-containing protein n=1 Tax=Favolaschia claudopus TaxID=2862362 RepID=A0AAV9ZHE1_9AGAR